MFKKILISNRGEIAIRIIRACKELGIKTVAVYSEADKNSLHVKFADEAFCIGPALPKKSYLNIPAIIATAEVSGAEAIHPGYGFLAENDNFSEICQENNIVFIGATPENIRLMGNKNEARKTMVKHGIPIIPGSKDLITNETHLEKIANEIGFPVIIKASAGGGGKGMRIIRSDKEVREMFRLAVAESQAAFGNGDVYVEKYIENPHHIEFQILADGNGHAVHLGERDCSIQRRHQKLIEEAPSPFLNETLRNKMGAIAVKVAKTINYQGAGTIEFLVDKNHNFYFMEMNTRIQVEHPITEEITKIDLIKEQIMIAATKKLPLKQKDIQIKGHSIEFRINAEDYHKNFMPCPGKVNLMLPAGGIGVRFDSHIYPGYQIPSAYDSMLGKLIIWGSNRKEAIARAERALNEFVIDGISTTIPFHLKVLQTKNFKNGVYDTNFLEELLKTNV
ncbi:MAG: acetyl-CoA carboxylase biotin carboxylase subunit [Candidatus Margulisiibacteriota bacterium]